MSENLKISRKTFTLPQTASHRWKFEQRPGGWIIAEAENGVRRRILLSENRGRVGISLRGYLCSGEWVHSHRTVKGSPTDGDLIAQFPGKVRKILIEKGATVLEGDSLVLVEAMKMEFSIRAPYSGKVKEVLVKEGQQISPGDLFVELEAVESDS